MALARSENMEPESLPGMDSLPVDSDVDTPGPRHRSIHLHPGFVVLVMLGGCFGALARYGLSITLPVPGGWPLPTLLINVCGAFALGALLEGLSRRGPDLGWSRFVRLLVGTGFMGAFTTYSTLAVDAMHLFDADRPVAALTYVALSIVGGVAAALFGIWVGAKYHRFVAARNRRVLAITGKESK